MFLFPKGTEPPALLFKVRVHVRRSNPEKSLSKVLEVNIISQPQA